MSSTEVKSGQLRKFGLVFAAITLLVALVSLWRGRDSLVMPFFAVSGSFFLISLVYPVLLVPLYYGMLRLSGYMGWFNTRVLLIIVYYLVFTPIALVFKLMGKDPLAKRFDREASTYWQQRDRGSADGSIDEQSRGQPGGQSDGESCGPAEGETQSEKERAYHFEKQF